MKIYKNIFNQYFTPGSQYCLYHLFFDPPTFNKQNKKHINRQKLYQEKCQYQEDRKIQNRIISAFNFSLLSVFLFFFSRTFTNIPFHRHSDISREVIEQRSPLDIASSRTRTENLWLPIACR